MPQKRKGEEYPVKSGILITEKINPSGSHAFRVTIAASITGAKREQRQFLDRKDAQDYAKQRHIEIQRFGHSAFALTANQRGDAYRALGILKPFNFSLEDAAKFVAKQIPQQKEQLTVKELFLRFIVSPGKRKSCAMIRRQSTLTNISWRIGRFQKKFGTRVASQISTDEIKSWMTSLGQQSPVSLNNYRRVLHSLFAFGLTEGYCANNPVSKIQLFSIPQKTPSILSVEQAESLLNAARSTSDSIGLFGYVVLALFTGLRRSEIVKLDWSAVKFDRRMVTVDGHIAKTGSIRNVSLSDNAMAWLESCRDMNGSVAPLNTFPKLRKIRHLAGIKKWDGNELRHSFASYHYDLHQNGPLTAAQLGHSSGCHLLFTHYRSLVPLGDGKRFFAIYPTHKSAS